MKRPWLQTQSGLAVLGVGGLFALVVLSAALSSLARPAKAGIENDRKVRGINPAGPPSPAGLTLFVAHGGGFVGAAHGGEIGIIDQTTYAYTTLGSYGSLTSLASDGVYLYAYQATTGNLLKISPVNGAILASVATAFEFTDMAYDPTTGKFYGMDINRFFYQINVANGAVTLISNTPYSGGSFLSLAISPGGTLYVHALNSPGAFYTVNKATGAVLTTITGGVPGGALGLEVDPVSGLLIASECCNGSDNAFGERLWSVNPTTGVATMLFDYNDGRRMHDFAFANRADTTPPVIVCPGGLSKFTDSGQFNAIVNPGVAVATDNVAVQSVTGVRSDGKPLSAPYPLGVTTITWTARDTSGNTSSCGQSIAVMAPSGGRRRP